MVILVQEPGLFALGTIATQGILKATLSLKNATPTSIKHFLTKYFIESY